jgi:hypothetical protein
MPSKTSDGGVSSVAEEEARTRFFANMSAGLHAMAQPLTILRSSIPASAAQGNDPIKQQRYLALSSQQIERACNLFDSLQELVIASQIEADSAPIDFVGLLAGVVDDQQAVLQAYGVEFRMADPCGLPNVLGDAARTRQALSAALKLAASIAVAGDVVELLAFAAGGYVESIIRNSRVQARSLNSSERLSLSLAQTNMLSQRGKFEYAEGPFCMRIALPIEFSVP